VIRKAGSEEAVLIANLDISQNARMREGWRFTKNRRPDTYASISKPVAPEYPEAQGYIMPAEWERHQGTWLAWPEDGVTFPKRLPKVRNQYLRIVELLHSGEEVHLAVRNRATQQQIQKLLRKRGVNLKRVQFHIWDYADVWFRDYGPTFVVQRQKAEIAIVQWQFNAWGGKYESLMKDGGVPYFISERLGLQLFRPNVILEGGAIDVNGQGSVLTTEQCLLNPNRNPGVSKAEMEEVLRHYLGVSNVIWLKSGISGDDTDGHIDNLARFVGAGTAVCAFEDNVKDENHAPLKANYDVLCGSRDQNGNALKVIKLPMPPPRFDVVRGERRRLPESYVNFYVGNEVVLVPAFRNPNDEVARQIIQDLFPERKAVSVDCSTWFMAPARFIASPSSNRSPDTSDVCAVYEEWMNWQSRVR
jgi:agmatine deiminase